MAGLDKEMVRRAANSVLLDSVSREITKEVKAQEAVLLALVRVEVKNYITSSEFKKRLGKALRLHINDNLEGDDMESLIGSRGVDALWDEIKKVALKRLKLSVK